MLTSVVHDVVQGMVHMFGWYGLPVASFDHCRLSEGAPNGLTDFSTTALSTEAILGSFLMSVMLYKKWCINLIDLNRY